MMKIRTKVELAPLTTLRLGGPAQYFVTCRTTSQIRDAIRWANRFDLAVTPLGGGSNVVVSDDGLEGLCIQVTSRGITPRKSLRQGAVDLVCQAGTRWDDVVSFSVRHGLAGIECLSGIPGTIGAAPIQNIGAYGQELSSTLGAIQALDIRTGKAVLLAADECGLRFRSSDLREGPLANRFIITSVRLRLVANGDPTLDYDELRCHVTARGEATLSSVRDSVISLRQRKGMLTASHSRSGRNVGSFFVNPILRRRDVERIRAWAQDRRVDPPPSYSTDDRERLKLSAAWLIEKSGISRGQQFGAAYVSRKHALCLMADDHCTTAELLGAASEIRDRVHQAFQVQLKIEPMLLGLRDSYT